MKICTVVGARPQFVKAAVVSRAFQKLNNCTEIIIHTGQHFDENMSDIFFTELSIPKPTYNLGVGGGTHGVNTGRMLEKIESVLIAERPDLLLVYGDTDSTLAGALAASKLHIPVAHVEAGLRSFNRKMPEEINRVLTDHISTWLFAPTLNAINQAQKEGINSDQLFLVGDVMYDATLYYLRQIQDQPKVLNKFGLESKSYVLLTMHRAENVDDISRLRKILEGLQLSGRKIVWPVHPRTRKMIEKFGLEFPANIILLDPIGYMDMLILEQHAACIATDSGGVQKEAYFHKVPCVTMRDETEWVELVSCGANVLTGAHTQKIADAIEKSETVNCQVFNTLLYGSGNAADLIINALLSK